MAGIAFHPGHHRPHRRQVYFVIAPVQHLIGVVERCLAMRADQRLGGHRLIRIACQGPAATLATETTLAGSLAFAPIRLVCLLALGRRQAGIVRRLGRAVEPGLQFGKALLRWRAGDGDGWRQPGHAGVRVRLFRPVRIRQGVPPPLRHVAQRMARAALSETCLPCRGNSLSWDAQPRVWHIQTNTRDPKRGSLSRLRYSQIPAVLGRREAMAQGKVVHVGSCWVER
jgi:hypothetical protein